MRLFTYEKALGAMQGKHVVGCDEAGRGPLAGPLVCAAVVLDPKNPIAGLDDSKKLTASKREALFDQIIEKAKAYAIVEMSHEAVDRLNVYQASRQGMIQAVKDLGIHVDHVLTDAMPLNDMMPYTSIIKGDQLSASIAAASILAKVTRDARMHLLAKTYPKYGFERHKGYPTKAHLDALKTFGPCPVHRKTFKPVKDAMVKVYGLAL